jgi:hypothetical protein
MSVPREKDIERMRKNKQEYIDSIAEESDMDSEKEREIIREALDEKIIKEELVDAEIEKNSLGPSFIQDIKSTFGSKGASRSRARISDILLQDDNIKIIFSIIGKDDMFNREYSISNSFDKELEDIFVITNTKASEPNELEGCKVPVKPSYSSIKDEIKYHIDTPPEELGLGSRARYRLSRILRGLDLLRYHEGRKFYHDLYTPTRRLEFIVLSIALICTLSLPHIDELFSLVLIIISVISMAFVVSKHLTVRTKLSNHPC